MMAKQWKQLTIKLEPELLKEIAIMAAEIGISKGAFIRVALENYLNTRNTTQPRPGNSSV
jgi:metal-responsive CopG/Arc/MetJ family transcriptional regulator